jgi:hypothetical protein
LGASFGFCVLFGVQAGALCLLKSKVGVGYAKKWRCPKIALQQVSFKILDDFHFPLLVAL